MNRSLTFATMSMTIAKLYFHLLYELDLPTIFLPPGRMMKCDALPDVCIVAVDQNLLAHLP